MSTGTLRYSPAKRKPSADEEEQGFTTPKGKGSTGRQYGEATEWKCPDPECNGAPLLKKSNKKGTSAFVTCTNNVYKDPTTCGFTASLFRQDHRDPHLCGVCIRDVGGWPSLGRPTDQLDDQGKTVWDNYHVDFSHCVGRKASGKLPACTRATSSQVGLFCAAFEEPLPDEELPTDLREGCVGEIQEGDLLVKEWKDKPLHARCAKRIHEAAIEEILATKNEHRILGTTPSEEHATPSASITDEDFDL